MVILVVLSLGLHWAFLQTVAWTGMAVRYARENTIEQAISMTLDGQHPCNLCHVIKKGREEERKQEQQQGKLPKLDFALVWETPLRAPALPHARVALKPSFLIEHPPVPPKPPPRLTFA